MAEKYVKVSSVVEIVQKHSREAIDAWDMDAVVVCGKILRDIDMLTGKMMEPESDYGN